MAKRMLMLAPVAMATSLSLCSACAVHPASDTTTGTCDCKEDVANHEHATAGNTAVVQDRMAEALL